MSLRQQSVSVHSPKASGQTTFTQEEGARVKVQNFLAAGNDSMLEEWGWELGGNVAGCLAEHNLFSSEAWD